jgi:CubicO group peptidase (beta-lactamase class C family)
MKAFVTTGERAAPGMNRRKVRSLFIGTLLLAASACAAAKVAWRAAPDGVPGAVLVTAEADGEPSFDCVGECAPGRRMAPDTMFWMASNTKGVLGALVLALATEGRLSLDDSVEKYFPSWKSLAATNRPTVRMLLCHTSGLARFPKTALPRPGMAALAERAAERPLAYEPGTKYLYSNWDIDVAAAITEKVTGRAFDVEMRERIFGPLGMKDTVFVPTAEQNARRAVVYRLSDASPPQPEKLVRKLVAPYLEVGEHPEAGGGLLSTPQDMIRFFQMIARGGRAPDGRVLISDSLMREWAAKQTPPAVKTAYSFGMFVDGRGGISHGGACGTWGEANVKTRKARLYMVNFLGASKASRAFRGAWMKSTGLVEAVRAARSVHLWYMPSTGEKATGVQATVTVRDTVPGTYFCAACFNMGYCGFQEHFDGSRVFIFSVWDPGDPFDFSANPDAVGEERRVKCLFSKDGVRIRRFGGEGTGGQAMAPYPWKTGVPETVRITAEPDGASRVAFTAWVKRRGAGDEWERMATFSTLHGGKGARIRHAAAFVEDFRRNFESARRTRRADFTDVCFFAGGIDSPRRVVNGVFSADNSPSRAVSAEPAPGGWTLATGGDTPDRADLLNKPIAAAPRR